MNLNKAIIIFWLLLAAASVGWYSYFLEFKNNEECRAIAVQYRIEKDSLKKRIKPVDPLNFSYWYVVYTRPDGANYSYGMKAVRLVGQEFSYVKAARIITIEHETYGVNLFFVNIIRIDRNGYYEYLYEKGSAIHRIDGINTLGEINKEFRNTFLNIKN